MLAVSVIERVWLAPVASPIWAQRAADRATGVVGLESTILMAGQMPIPELRRPASAAAYHQITLILLRNT